MPADGRYVTSGNANIARNKTYIDSHDQNDKEKYTDETSTHSSAAHLAVARLVVAQGVYDLTQHQPSTT